MKREGLSVKAIGELLGYDRKKFLWDTGFASKPRYAANRHLGEAWPVSRRVGYESSSPFSREYSRLFGTPPVREIGEANVRRAGLNEKRPVKSDLSARRKLRLRSLSFAVVSQGVKPRGGRTRERYDTGETHSPPGGCKASRTRKIPRRE